ncbi:MAG: hypothetical protein Q8O99_02315 [bacterium]|nr:hypothetical protein [bacterium]
MLPLLAALVGFGDFKISTLALPLIAVGGCLLIFIKNEKLIRVAKLLVGFGLLFI